jgi:competence protein ComEC
LVVCGIYRIWKFRITFLYHAQYLFYIGVASEKNGLAAFAVFICIYYSYPGYPAVFDVGFQLSFLAVLGIFWLNQPLLNYFPKQDHYLKKLLFNTVTISLSAQLATLPLVLYYFHQFSFISIVANFIIVPFSEVIILFSFLMTALIAISIDFGLISKFYDFISILLKMIHWFAQADILFFENIPMNLVEIGFVFLIIYLLRFVLLNFNFRNLMRGIMAVLHF